MIEVSAAEFQRNASRSGSGSRHPVQLFVEGGIRPRSGRGCQGPALRGHSRVGSDEGDRVVTVLPISHPPPADPELAVELPAATKRRLGLDDERSRVIFTEANRFLWPGPHLRP